MRLLCFSQYTNRLRQQPPNKRSTMRTYFELDGFLRNTDDQASLQEYLSGHGIINANDQLIQFDSEVAR